MILGGMLTGWTYEGRKLYSGEDREIIGHNYVTQIHGYVVERILETSLVTCQQRKHEPELHRLCPIWRLRRSRMREHAM